MHSYVSWDFLVEIEDNCLNPCFNGRCTRTLEETTNETNATGVLILVLMEDALVLLGCLKKKFGLVPS